MPKTKKTQRATKPSPRIAKPPRHATIKKIALSLPGAHEVVDRHGVWFNIGTKTFALCGMGNGQWIFKLPMHQQMMLFDARPETFTPMRAGRLLWSYVQVEKLDAVELKDLLIAAWRLVVTKKMAKAYEAA